MSCNSTEFSRNQILLKMSLYHLLPQPLLHTGELISIHDTCDNSRHFLKICSEYPQNLSPEHLLSKLQEWPSHKLLQSRNRIKFVQIN